MLGYILVYICKDDAVRIINVPLSSQSNCCHLFCTAAMNKLDRSLLRCLLRKVQGKNSQIFLQPRLRPEEFQRHVTEVPVSMAGYLNWIRDRRSYFGEIPLPIASALRSSCSNRLLTHEELLRAIRYGFRNIDVKRDIGGNGFDRHDIGFEALRMLSEQSMQAESTSVTFDEMNKIRVICSAIWIPTSKAFEDTDYMGDFMYRVTIENLGDDPIQILGRHWEFKGSCNDQHLILVLDISQFTLSLMYQGTMSFSWSSLNLVKG